MGLRIWTCVDSVSCSSRPCWHHGSVYAQRLPARSSPSRPPLRLSPSSFSDLKLTLITSFESNGHCPSSRPCPSLIPSFLRGACGYHRLPRLVKCGGHQRCSLKLDPFPLPDRPATYHRYSGSPLAPRFCCIIVYRLPSQCPFAIAHKLTLA
ncbi:hypothetical protein FB45DRAFT_1064851 [Roridomyces roridus]|uniref:Uncharacterized protein n=1 Tax=Roridomyces roridus TaxID=1738132 RepID=A0AAD7FEG0_9AGAR|nr:hypothetical protein FB45DRAFT_1064851 [Roridomyces roridus]